MRGSGAQQAPEDSQLLATKLYTPRVRAALLTRPRLFDRLDAALDCALTIISAPTGSGKTVLLADWISRHERLHALHVEPASRSAIAWLSLDKGDDDLAQFLRYLVAACRSLVPSAGTALLPLLHSAPTQLPAIPGLLTGLINDLARMDLPGVLVLDDYQAAADLRIHEAVAFLIDHAPPGLHVVITTRTDPPLPLARWRAHGQLAELRIADLRFTADEATAFLTQVMRIPLSESDVHALDQRTEGWIAGLQFAALAMRDRADLHGFVSAFTGSHRFVLDYLVDEVLLRQSLRRQAFLLRTSILDRMTGPLCDALLSGAMFEAAGAAAGREAASGQSLLEELEQDNLFVVPLDDERRWYRYHHLFADVLRNRLEHSTSPEEVRALHAHAASWLEQNGLIAEAIQHYLQAADHERYALLVEQVGLQHFSRGEFCLLQRWLAPIPDELVNTRPFLSLISAWAMSFTANIDAVAALVDQTERLRKDADFETLDPEYRNHIDGELLVLRGFVALRRRQFPEAIKLKQQAHALLSPSQPHVRGMNLHHLGLAQRQNLDFVAACQTFLEAVAIFSGSAETHSFAVYPLKNLGMIEELRGRLRRAELSYRRAVEHAVVGERPLPSAGHAYLCLGRLSYEWNDLPTAANYLHQAIELGTQGGLNQVIAEAAIELAPVLQAQGAIDQVDGMLHVARDAAHLWNDVGHIARAAAAEARLRLIQGRLAEAASWAEDAHVDLDDLAEVELSHLTYARLLLVRGNLGDAWQLLKRIATPAETSGHLRPALEAMALLAVAEHGMGDITPALATLEHALLLAEPEGYIRTFLDVGPAMVNLIEQGMRKPDWLQGPTDRDEKLLRYARTLLESYPARPAPSILQGSPPTQYRSGGVEMLTPRESEVLHLIAAGKSNAEIASTMVVAISTVKAHINNIFGKLGVTSRTQALVRARELHLL